MDKIKDKTDLHLLRKLWHALPGLAIVFLIQSPYFELWKIEEILSKVVIFSFVMEFLRLKNETLNNAIVKIFGPILRKEEVNNFSGLTSYLLGVSFSIIFFSKDISSLSILILSFCDPVASICGVLGKDHKVNHKFENKKSLFGLLGFILTALVISIIFGMFFMSLTFPQAFTLGTLLGVSCGFVELFPVGKINDNLSIPFAASIIAWIILLLLI